MSESRLTVTDSRSGDACIVSLAGRIDSSNAADFATRLKGFLQSGARLLVLDFGSVIYMTSAALRALLQTATEAEHTSSRLTLCSLTEPVRELFEICGFVDTFTIAASREEALARLG